MGKPLGILGGTFDPIHYGHLRPAREILRALDLAEIRFIPAACPPHRRPPLATAEQRLSMVKLAVADTPGFSVDDRELKRGGLSYTVPTLESLRAEVADRPLCILMGADAFEGIETWRQWQRLPELAHMVVMARPGWAVPSAEALPAWARGRLGNDPRELTLTPGGKIYFQTVTPQDISATQIRAAIARDEPIEKLLPSTVADYIRRARIYINRGN